VFEEEGKEDKSLRGEEKEKVEINNKYINSNLNNVNSDEEKEMLMIWECLLL
jgi:hypothetical protein